jgi:hypothetical protein
MTLFQMHGLDNDNCKYVKERDDVWMDDSLQNKILKF